MSGPEYLPLLPSFPPSPTPISLFLSIYLAAEIIKKECLALVEQMIERARKQVCGGDEK